MKMIVLKYRKRKTSSSLGYFLRMFGFLVDSVSENMLLFNYFDKWKGFGAVSCDAEHVYVDLTEHDEVPFHVIEDIIERQDMAFSEEDVNVIKEMWEQFYCGEMTEWMYTISELYINRKMRYPNVRLLEKAIYGLDDAAGRLEANKKWIKNMCGKLAYCYLACQVNDALEKMEEWPWYDALRLAGICDAVLAVQHGFWGLYLLKADILRNRRGMQEKVMDSYCFLRDIRLTENVRIGDDVRKYALLELGERYQTAAEKERKLLYPKAVEYYLQFEAIDPNNIRVLFKIAMQMERRAQRQMGRIEEAVWRYERLCALVERIGFANVNNVEFEYYYKAKFRLGVIARMEKDIPKAIAQFSDASVCWDKLKTNEYLEDIYGEQGRMEVIRFLQGKYKKRDCVISQQLAELYENSGREEEAREYYIKANMIAHRFGQGKTALVLL